MSEPSWRAGYVLHDVSLPQQRRAADGPGPEISLYRPGGWLVLEAVGELDLQCVPRLRALLAAAGSRVVIDLTRVTFMDASGLGVLAVGGERARRSGGAVRLVGACRQVRRIVVLTQLDGVLPMFETVREAMTEDCPPPRPHVTRHPARVPSPRVRSLRSR